MDLTCRPEPWSGAARGPLHQMLACRPGAVVGAPPTPMLIPQSIDPASPARARDLAAQAWRACVTFGSRSLRDLDPRNGNDDSDNDDDDMPRPNAVVTVFPFLRFASRTLPA